MDVGIDRDVARVSDRGRHHEPQRRDLTRALPLLTRASLPALIRLELGGVSRGEWIRDEFGNPRQRIVLARIGSIAPLAINVALVGFEFLVAFLQAYVFAVLTCIYLHDAVHLH